MSAVPEARLHLHVRGRVQGVGFRAFVADAGQALGLSGWVRNVGADGVETVAEGPRQKLEKFLLVVRAGPRAARVDEARAEWETPSGEFRMFEIGRSL